MYAILNDPLFILQTEQDILEHSIGKMRRDITQRQFAPASPLIVKTESTLRGLSLNERAPPLLTSIPEDVQLDISQQVMGPIDLRVARLTINERDTDQVFVDFVCANPKEPAIVCKRQADIAQAQTLTIKDWITNYEQMVFFVQAGGAGMDSLEGHLTHLYKEKSGQGIPRQVDFYTTDLFCNRTLVIPSRYVATLNNTKVTEESTSSASDMDSGSYDFDEHGSNVPSLTVPVFKSYTKDKHPEILRLAKLDARPTIHALAIWLDNGNFQRSVEGTFQLSSSQPGLPMLPKRLIACSITNFFPLGGPRLDYPNKCIGWHDISYIDPQTGKDIIARIVEMFISCEGLAGYKGLVVDWNDPDTGKDYTSIVYLENKLHIRCLIYDQMNIGQSQQTRLVDGCWVPM
jgi:hypothetical protein